LNRNSKGEPLAIDHDADNLVKSAYQAFCEKRDIMIEGMRAEVNSLLSQCKSALDEALSDQSAALLRLSQRDERILELETQLA
jgi:uncharacterized protein